ncbi:hypothetical protein TWF569_001625 [Orbilia oligospora]|uniref:TauD/TfdA-like domain-containing protein n=1 Tax=Orbilia oligospora TaxID=2813651 RepID=A0A7C8JUQ1_ORBOL|nr:hypothetical protein TWF706_005756 [Orbilia oligospora]KAF3123867.1 hypothetical protein TWF569_001625 [Orbilia oligospora]KAF3128507.1 hypothetical protein TWF594_011560 [Orbilia oligospora]KAF3132966.1 hypothetical protein TWF703_007105 [Orbilia oligospora]
MESVDLEEHFFPRGVRQKYRLGEFGAGPFVPNNLFTTHWAEGPGQVTGRSAWSGATIVREDQYAIQLTKEHREELIDALITFQEHNYDLLDINKENFHLPTLGDVLERVSEKVYDGEGFVLLRGLNPREFTEEENIIVASGVSAYVGGKFGRQSPTGSMITHLTTLKGIETQAGYYSNQFQTFHNDHACDVISLYCLNPPASGGQVRLASASKTYQDIVETRPDIIPILADSNWIHQTARQNPLYIRRPLLYQTDDGKPFFCFSRAALLEEFRTHRLEGLGLPPLTRTQGEALNIVEMVADKNSIEIGLQSGDLVFINNLAVLHGRREFEDNEIAKRHMLRLWVHNPERAWQLPNSVKVLRDCVYMDLPDIPGWFIFDPMEPDPTVLQEVTSDNGSCGSLGSSK